MITPTPKALILLSFFLASGAFAANIDENNGCTFGPAADLAKKHCAHFEAVPLFKTVREIPDAQKQCQVYYELAHRLQNIFCSYEKDAETFRSKAAAEAGASEVGKASQSTRIVSGLSGQFADLNKEYLQKLIGVAPKFDQAYVAYIKKLGPINGKGGTNELNETQCAVQLIKTQLPGYLQVSLARLSQGDAQRTYNQMWPATRANMMKMKQAMTVAQTNGDQASTSSLNLGDITSQGNKPAPDPTVKPEPPKDPQSQAQDIAAQNSASQESMVNPAADPAVKLGLQQLAVKYLQPYIGTVLGKLGGGISTFIYDYTMGRQVQGPELIATFVGMTGTLPAVLATGAVIYGRHIEDKVNQYDKFCALQLKANPNMTSLQLIEAWAKGREDQACLVKINTVPKCEAKYQNRPMYEGAPSCP